MNYYSRKSLSKYFMYTIDFNKHNIDIFINDTWQKYAGDLEIINQESLCQINKGDIIVYLFLFMICSNGLRKSFWNLKFENSPFSRNFIDNCLRESTAKNAISSHKFVSSTPRCVLDINSQL
jgi:hypothetical protein